MKVLMINGSPHKEGCVFTALSEMAGEFEREGIDSEILWIGNKPIGGCVGCRSCAKLGKCAFDDVVNEVREKIYAADGYVFGSPVHCASMAGNLSSFMDRLFFSANMSGQADAFFMKPACCVVSARRAGTTVTLDQINRYFSMFQMPIVTARYWNMVHGMTPEQVAEDKEGMQVMRELARNMAYMLRCLEAGKKAGIALPRAEDKIMTNFVR